jgi:hypothetical protein
MTYMVDGGKHHRRVGGGVIRAMHRVRAAAERDREADLDGTVTP